MTKDKLAALRSAELLVEKSEKDSDSGIEMLLLMEGMSSYPDKKMTNFKADSKE
ncbi:MAG: hypothetical protein AAF806_25320 [Bacteroidota bacterium]